MPFSRIDVSGRRQGQADPKYIAAARLCKESFKATSAVGSAAGRGAKS